MTIVTAPAGAAVAPFRNGYDYDLHQNLSVRADQISSVGSVVFTFDGHYLRTENIAPYSAGGDSNGSYTAWKPSLGNHTLVATPHAETNGNGITGPSVVVGFTVIKPTSTPAPTPTATTIRINCGGPGFLDSSGNKWSADVDFAGGSVFTFGHAAVARTSDATPYQTERYAQTLIYNIPVVNGTYNVTLDLAEMYFNSAGRRIFSVALAGHTVLQNLDICALVGSNTALRRTFPVTVTSGMLKIVGTASVNNAKFSAIEVMPAYGHPTPTPTPTPTATPTATPITSVGLAWNASSSSGIAGYRVSYGGTSGAYTQRADVGNKTSAVISGLTSNKTYYFAVSAYNASGAESPVSNEVSFSTTSSGSSSSTAPLSATATITPGATEPLTSGSTPQLAATAPSSSSRSSSSSFLENLSARVHVGSGNNVEVVGFTISGSGQKTVIIRALGPSLTGFGLEGVLADPVLEIRNRAGDIIASNDNWSDAQQAVFASGGRFHTFQPSSNVEPAVAITLPPGTYTAVVSGKNGLQGVSLAEVYDFSQDTGTTLTNLSMRAQVLTGENVLIGGFTVRGSSRLRMVLRAIGPTLARYGVAEPLQNPVMGLYNANGTLLRSSDTWRFDATQASELMTSGYAPTDSREPAMIVLLPAGTYTAVVQGKSDSTGIALFDAYTLN